MRTIFLEFWKLIFIRKIPALTSLNYYKKFHSAAMNSEKQTGGSAITKYKTNESNDREVRLYLGSEKVEFSLMKFIL